MRNENNKDVGISDLLQRRIEAAHASGGTSSQPILDTAMRVIKGSKIEGGLLEFGAGTGEFLSKLIDYGYAGKMIGVDLLERPQHLPHSVEWVQADLNNPLPFSDASFDVVVSTEVIEHLENPRAVVREFNRLLKPSGRVILTTPNQESIRSFCCLVFGGHYAAFQDSCYPAHITPLLRKDIQRIFLEAGFSAPDFHFTNHGCIPKLTHWSFQQISFGFLKGRLFSDNILAMSRKLP